MTSTVSSDDETKRDELLQFIASLHEKEYPPHSYLVAVLHKAQELYRYLRKDVIAEISTIMQIPVATIWGVATFYHYFNLEPRGDYVISVCLGTACYVKGAEKILEALKKELDIHVGETTEDLKFTLLTTRCLGACALSPTMMINGRVYSQLTAKKIANVIQKLRGA